jgi:aldehyde dehydrogenase
MVQDSQLEAIVNKVVRRVLTAAGDTPISNTRHNISSGEWGVFDEVNDAVTAAHEAFLKYQDFGLQDRKKFTDAIRRVTLDYKEEFSRMALEQTGMGRLEHKIAKHVNVAKHSSGIEYLQPNSWSGKNGTAIEDYAPYGVIGNITPSTHPSPTMLDNMIIQIAAGNTIAFNPHPVAKKLNAYVVQCCNRYLVEEGAPPNMVTCISEPTMETAEALFAHPLTKLLSVTGGPAIVEAAMKHSKPIIAAGPGNPPVLIDETADLQLAAQEITHSSAYDNNILCIAEKEIFVVDKVYDAFMKAFKEAGNYRLADAQMELLAQKALEKHGKYYIIGRDYVGKNASVLARAIGIHISDDVPLLFGETGPNHPWVVAEQLTPCIPVIRARDFEQGMAYALKAEHGFGHTASIFTQNMNRATTYARKMDCDVVVVNGGTLRGNGGDLGEAYFSHTIASPTGQSVVTPRDFCRRRRLMVSGALRFV